MSRIIDRGLEEAISSIDKNGRVNLRDTYRFHYMAILKEKAFKVKSERCRICLLSMADKVEDQTFQLIARFQPVASDLRDNKILHENRQ